jgi:3-phenylpropionate/cinnamic acid dioxygenase small subunit
VSAGWKELARDLVALEAQLLDEQRWSEWLALYCEDAVFWVPTWKDERTLADDPMTQLSLIYIDSRARLEERVKRLTSGTSVAAMPVPRTAHVVGSVLVRENDEGTLHAACAWTSHVYTHKQPDSIVHAGRYEHVLRIVDGQLRIARKKIVLVNDLLRSKLDFFYV